MVASPSRTSATAQAGPMLAWDCVGYSYSPSMMRAACLKPSSTEPFSRWIMRLTTGALRICVVQPVIAREIRLRLRPGHLEGRRRLDGVPFLLGHDREQVLDPDHLRAGNVCDRAFIDLDRHGARDRRADHARVQHAGQPQVVDMVKRAEHLAGQIPPRQRLADDLELVGVFSGA